MSKPGYIALLFKYGLHFHGWQGRFGVKNLRRNFALMPGLAAQAGHVGGKSRRRGKPKSE